MNWLPVVKKEDFRKPITDCRCVVEPETFPFSASSKKAAVHHCISKGKVAA